MDKNVLVLFVVTTYKAITVFNIEPLDSSKYIGCNNFFNWLGRLFGAVIIIIIIVITTGNNIIIIIGAVVLIGLII